MPKRTYDIYDNDMNNYINFLLHIIFYRMESIRCSIYITDDMIYLINFVYDIWKNVNQNCPTIKRCLHDCSM